VDNRQLILEGDAGGLIIWSTEFKEWLLESREQFFAVKPGGYPPYFDGQSIFYALLSFITDGFSTAQGPMILTYRYVNALAWVGGGLLMFSSAWQVCGNAILSTALVFLYATTPALLEVSLLRIDHLIMCLFMAMIAISLWIADRPTPISIGVLLVYRRPAGRCDGSRRGDEDFVRPAMLRLCTRDRGGLPARLVEPSPRRCAFGRCCPAERAPLFALPILLARFHLDSHTEVL
jgi:hypothetical protein